MKINIKNVIKLTISYIFSREFLFQMLIYYIPMVYTGFKFGLTIEIICIVFWLLGVYHNDIIEWLLRKTSKNHYTIELFFTLEDKK